ncbi:methyl-accepting chemotaxis protein [Fusibacter sp. JL298sf-3]
MNEIKVKRSIRKLVISIFVAVILIVQILVGGLTYWRVSGIIKSDQLKATQDVGDQIAMSMESYLSGYQGIVEALSKQALLADPAINERAILEVLDSYASSNDGIFSIYMGTTAGKMLVKPDDDLGSDYDPRTRDWYTLAKDSGKFVWTDAYFDDTVNAMMITACAPVYNAQGKFAGVIAADLLLDTLNDQTKDLRIGEKGYPITVDANNIIMTHVNPSKIGEEMDSEVIKAALVEGRMETLDYTNTEDGEKHKKLASFSPIESVGWTVVSSFYYDEIQADLNTIITNIALASLLGFVIAVILVFLFTKSFNDNIKRLVEAMKTARTGDLSVHSDIQSKDEIGVLSKFFDETISDLGKLVNNVQQVSGQLTTSSQSLAATSEEVSASADEVAKTVEDIAKGAQDQAQDAEQSTLVARALSEKFVRLNEFTDEMLLSAKSTTEAYEGGLKSVGDLSDKNRESMDANKAIETVILQLNDRTQEIGGILDSISAISVQTNLLALNASIEAARAGEHGRGFAVVAEEIRKLAEESANAAEQVKEIVLNIQQDGAESVSSMTTLKTISENQNSAVNDVIGAFETIKSAFQKITRNIDEIGQSVSEVNEDKERIVSSIENISAVSEETAAASEEVTASMDQQTFAVEEVAKSAQDLNQISVHLNEEISKFKI